MTLKNIAKNLVRSSASLTYYMLGQHRRANLGQVVVLMYHRVLADSDPYIPFIQPGMYVRESSFNRQLEFLADNYEIISVLQMLELIESRSVSKDKQYCVITFDDGWLDNYQHAFPILKKFSAPATIFLATTFIGSYHFFWHEKISRLFYYARDKHTLGHSSLSREAVYHSAGNALALLRRHVLAAECSTATIDAAIEVLKPFPVPQIEEAVDTLASELGISFDNERTMLNWDEVDEMGRNNISFGSHTCGHQILTQIEPSEAAKEINSSMQVLKNRVANFVPVFCYPNGRYNEQVRSLVADAGYSAAVSTKRGRASIDLQDRFSIMRIGIHDDIAHTKPLFSYRLR